MMLGLIQSMRKRHSRIRPPGPIRRQNDGSFAAKDSSPTLAFERPTNDRRQVLHESTALSQWVVGKYCGE
jgi:hypothetical protein